jgi:hypothetical protein
LRFDVCGLINCCHSGPRPGIHTCLSSRATPEQRDLFLSFRAPTRNPVIIHHNLTGVKGMKELRKNELKAYQEIA